MIANELTMLHRIKMNKKPLPTVAVIDTQSVKNTATATRTVGFDGGKLIKGRKRFLIVDTIGYLLWTEVNPANVADGKTGVAVWTRAKRQNALLDDLVLLHADSTFGGHFKRELTDYYDMDVAISRSPVGVQPVDGELVIHR